MTARFLASKSNEFAPSTVTFTNLSSSSSTISGTSSITSVWTYGNGELDTTVSSFQMPATVYHQAGTYTVILYATKGECIDTAVIVINIETPSRLQIPNVFSPNGDGINDVFFVKAAMLRRINAEIFDRWGQLVYEVNSTTGNIEWDGTNQKGKPVAAGTYYLALFAEGYDGRTYDSRTTITLVR